MEPVSIALALVAGLLSTLSPCVLPLLPAILIVVLALRLFLNRLEKREKRR